jgi:YHS domain-containing protein
MAIAGLLTEGIFSLFGGIPRHSAISIKQAHFEWNYTTYLNFIFIIVAIVVWWLARNRAKFGGGVGYAIDPVCGMQVRTVDAPAMTMHEGVMIHFCSDRCMDRFVANPHRFTGAGFASEGMKSDDTPSAGMTKASTGSAATVIDPICGMSVDPATAAAHRVRDGNDYWFCSADCAITFDKQKAQL